MGRAKLAVRVRGVSAAKRLPRRRPLLVVETNGRRHRFSALQSPRSRSVDGVAEWSATFAVPAWLGASLDGQCSLSFTDGTSGIPLPSISRPGVGAGDTNGNGYHGNRSGDNGHGANGHGANGHRGNGSADAALRAKLEPRPMSANGRAKYETRISEMDRLARANAQLRRELDRTRQAVREARADRDSVHQARDTYYTSANNMARTVANMHSKMTAAIAAKHQVVQERDRLAKDLASLQSELSTGAPSVTDARRHLTQPA